MGGCYIGPGGFRGIVSWEMDQTLIFPLFGIGSAVELDIVPLAGRS
jgi:hypothetical protein